MSRSVMPSVEDVSYSTLSGCGWASDCGPMFRLPKCAATNYPPYKAMGMGYIRFAAEERELFRLLFMRDRSGEEKSYRLSPMWNSTGSPRLAMAL